jgi:hypothetical protein
MMKTYSLRTGDVTPRQATGDRWQGRTALSQDEHDWLVRLKTAVDQHWDELTAFEQKFAEDLLERFRQWGVNTRISPKQWEIIAGISEKVL